MALEGYRARRAGSVRFDPYYKVELWDARQLSWRPVQRRFSTEEEAQASVPTGARGRLTRITEHGRVVLREVPASPA